MLHLHRIGAKPAHFAGLSLIGNQVRILDSPAAVSRKTASPALYSKSLRIRILGKAIGNSDKSEDLPFNKFSIAYEE